MSWWRRHWRLLLGGIVVVLGALVGGILWALQRHAEALRLKQTLQIMQAKNAVAGLEADKRARRVELQTMTSERVQLEAAILHAKKQAVAAVKDVKNLTNIEILDEFRKLGY